MTPEELQAQVDALIKENADLKAAADQLTKERDEAKAATGGPVDQSEEYKELVARSKADLDAKDAEIERILNENTELAIAAKRTGIYTLEMAIEYVKKNYPIPAKVQRVMVTQDGSAFFDDDISSGATHAKEKNLLSFTFNKPS